MPRTLQRWRALRHMGRTLQPLLLLATLARLFRSPVGASALEKLDLLEAVVRHKKLFFSSAWANYDSARPGTLRLVPSGSRRKALEADYRAMQEMIFGEAPPLAEILAVLGALKARLNGG